MSFWYRLTWVVLAKGLLNGLLVEVLWSACLSVCTHVKKHMSCVFPVCFLWPCLGLPLMATQYVIYFHYCG